MSFLDQTQLENAINGAPTPQPPPVQAVQGWQGTVIVNNTQFLLTLVDQFFDSGEFQTAPPGAIQPFSFAVFTVMAKTISFAGATGAIAYTFEPLPSVSCNLGVGFGNPAVGSFDSNAAFDADHNQIPNSGPILPLGLFTQGTYNANSSSPVQTSSAIFTGADTNGLPTTIQFIGQSTPGVVSNVTITQAIVSGGE
jgi:hypothetical protein